VILEISIKAALNVDSVWRFPYYKCELEEMIQEISWDVYIALYTALRMEETF